MKKCIKIGLVLLTVICLMLSFSVIAFAEPKMTGEEKGTLTVKFQETQKSTTPDCAVEGLEIMLYKVCSMGNDGSLTLVEPFQSISIDEENPQNMLESASNIVVSNQFNNPTYTTKTDASKEAKFQNLDKGVYFVTTKPYWNAENTTEYTVTGGLVSVPSSVQNENEWNFNPVVELKGFEVTGKQYEIEVVWEDDDTKDRPDSIHVILRYESDSDVEIKSETDWKEVFNGKTVDYQIIPQTINNYTAHVEKIGNKIIVKYTHDEVIVEPSNNTVVIEIGPMEEEEIPNTGLLWWPVTVLAVAGVLFVSYGLIRRKHSNEE